MLRGNLSTTVVEVLRGISRDSDFIDSQNYTPIHRIVLRLSLKDLEKAILQDLENVDARDAMGRTALEWAAARGDDRATITLLSFGAEPNVIDKKMNTPLTLASKQGHTLCVRLLLEAGALADPILPSGVKFGSPLNCAARNATDPLLVKTLLDFDPDVEACGVDGVTPLLHAARGKPLSFAKLFLDYGANINVMAKDGRTPLTTAIIYNNHGVLRLLLDRWFEYTECPRLKGPHLLDLIAEYADVETMTILQTAKHLQLRRDSSYVLEESTVKINNRLDLTDDLATALGSLLDAMRDHPKPSPGLRSPAKCTSPHPEKDQDSSEGDLDEKSQDMSDEEIESVDSYEDAQESLGLAFDDLSLLGRHQLPFEK